jgi:hypothetical protein
VACTDYHERTIARLRLITSHTARRLPHILLLMHTTLVDG